MPQNMGELSGAFVNTLLLPAPEGIDDGSKASFREPATAVKLRRDADGVMRAAKAEATLAVRERFGRWCIIVCVSRRWRRRRCREEEGRRRRWGASGGKRGQVGWKSELAVNRTSL